LKPDNALADRSGPPKVMGIGVARLIDSDQHEPEAGDPGGRHRAADRGGSTKALAADIRRCF